MPGSPMPWVKSQFFDNNGDPAAGYFLFTYSSGTTTKRATYSDQALSTPNTNPIELDSAGRATIFLSATNYKFVLAIPTDTDPPTSPIWTMDGVPAISPFAANLDLTATAGETIVATEFVYLSDGSGGTTAGRWYKTDADNTYSSTTAFVMGNAQSSATVGNPFTVRKTGQATGLAGLTAGTVYYISTTAGAITSSPPTNAIVIGKADSTTSLIMGQFWGYASATAPGTISLGAQTFAGVKTFSSQPQTYIGGAITLPATIGGVYFTDIVIHAVIAGQTDSVMSTTTIPANMLNADGKAVLVRLGSSTATTGAAAKTIELDVGGTQVAIRTSNTNDGSWQARVIITRIDSDSVDVAVIGMGITTGITAKVQRIDALDFTAAITVRSLATTGAASTFTQTYFTVEALG